MKKPPCLALGALLVAIAAAGPATPPASETDAAVGATGSLNVSEFIDVLSTRAVHTPGIEFNELTRGEIDYTQADLFALLGQVEFGRDWQWIPGFNYEFSRLDIDGYPFGANPAAPPLDRDLHSITFHNFILNVPSDSDWLHGAYLGTGVNSDFSLVGSRDLTLAVAFGSGYRFSDRFTAGLGIYGSNLLNDPFVVPAPVFFWMPSDPWLVSYYGPRFVARREFGENIRIGFEAAWNGGWWGVDMLGTDTRLEVDSIRAGFYYRQRIRGDAWLELGLGYTFANEVKIFSPGGRDLFPTALGEADPAPYVSLGFSLHRW